MMRGIDRNALLVSSAIVCVMATPAAAQSKSFDVPAQSLQSAVHQLGRQADIQIIAARKVTQGKQGNAVRGNMTAEEAIAQLLAGTGLVAKRTGAGTWTIVPLAGAAAASGGAQQAQGQAVLVGSVRDHKTGAALKGARVEVVETGASTSTGDLGDFRFARLPTGDVTLRVSYLGFPEQTETVAVVGGLTNRADVYLGSGVTTEIVVTGQVSARAQALNQQRTAENSQTVISGDLLGNFNGTTISDSLRRAPGVAFQQNDRSGDGTNIIIRGLSPDYNQVKLNGVSLAETTGTGRSSDLSTLLSDSVSQIKISKTLLASQSSSGTGGLVEIETKSPLDRPKRYFNISADGTLRGKGYGHEYSVSGTASLRFGAEGNFGVSASYQYRKQDISTYSYNASTVLGPYLPLGPNGQPAVVADLDPASPFPLFDGQDVFVNFSSANRNSLKSETTNLTLGAEWQVSGSTNLRLDYVRSERADDRLDLSYDLAGSTFYASNLPVSAEGGALRNVLTLRRPTLSAGNSVTFTPNATSHSDTISFRGKSALGALTLDFGAGHARGSSSNGDLDVSFSVGEGLSLPPGSPLLAPGVINPATGIVATYFGPRRGSRVPVPLLTAAGLDALRSLPLPLFYGAYGRIGTGGSSSNWTGNVSGKYEFDSGILKYIEAGVQYDRREFSSQQRRSTTYAPSADFNPVPVPDIGLIYDDQTFGPVSGDGVYRSITRASIIDFFSRIDSFGFPYFEDTLDPLLNGTSTREEDIAGFVQARLDIGRLEVIGGVRIERNKIDALAVSGTQIINEQGVYDQDFYDQTRQLINGRGSLTSVLPRILINWRAQENLIFRAGYYSTVARPQIFQLNSTRNIYYDARPLFGPTGSQPTMQITSGNPDLKPARTHNFDVSAELYDGNVGVIKASLFLKRIKNLLESNSYDISSSIDDVDLPSHPLLDNLPGDVFTVFSRPINNPDMATVWGAEFEAERRLSFLPGILSGLGVYANYTYSRSRKTALFPWQSAPIYDANGNVVDREARLFTLKLPFEQSPRHSGTIGLTYSRPGTDASLFYTAQSSRFNAYGDFRLHEYNAAVDSLDFRITHDLKVASGTLRIAFEATNLLKGGADANTQTFKRSEGNGEKYYQGGYFHGGRRFALGLSATF
jgi:TonB-dependent receptor